MELYGNFVPSKIRKSYENAALFAQATGKRLVYVIGTDHDDRVDQISDLKQWSKTIKNQDFSGAWLADQVHRHQAVYPHVSFVFRQKEEICQTIWAMVSK